MAQALARAHRLEAAIAAGDYADRADAARQLGFTRARITQILDLIRVDSLPETVLDPKQTPPEVRVKPVVGGQPEEVMTLTTFRGECPC